MMNRTYYHFAIFTLILLFTGTYKEQAAAQDDSASFSFLEMSLEELMNLEVTSASRIPEKSADVPATIYLITENQIRTRGYTNLEEVLEDIPEIEIQKKSSVEYSNYFTIRGVDGSE